MIDTVSLIRDLERWEAFGMANAEKRDPYNEGYFTGYADLSRKLITFIKAGDYNDEAKL